MHVHVFACHLALMSVTVYCLQSQPVECFLSLERAGPEDALSCFILRSLTLCLSLYHDDAVLFCGLNPDCVWAHCAPKFSTSSS